MKPWFYSLKTKLLLVLLAFGLIPFILVSFLSIKTIKNEIYQSIENKLFLALNAKSDEIFSYFDRLEDGVRSLARDPFFTNRLLALRTESLSTDERAALNAYLKDYSFKPNADLVQILLMDPNGDILASMADALPLLPAYYLFDPDSNDLSITEATEEDLQRYGSVFTISAPLRETPQSEVLGSFTLFFSTRELSSMLGRRFGFHEKSKLFSEQIVEETLQVYLVNSKRHIFVHPFFDDPSSQLQSSPVNTDPVRRCHLRGEAMRGTLYTNYQDQSVIGVSICLPDQNWVLIAEVNTDEAFTPLTIFYIRVFFVIILFILFIILSALVLSRKVTEPFKLLMANVRRVQDGDLKSRVRLLTRDEFGQLSIAFNQMTERLKASYGSLAQKVRVKTKALHEQLQRLAQEKAKDEAVLSSIGDGLVVADRNGTIRVLNHAAELMTGFYAKDIIGKPWSDVFKLKDSTGKLLLIKKHPLWLAKQQQKSLITTAYSLLRADQTTFPVAITASPILLKNRVRPMNSAVLYGGSRVDGAIMVFRDFTKEKEVERMKNEFISLVSHQLRTPLSGMKWFTEMLQVGDVGPLNQDQKEFITNINELNERMIDLVNALLNIARIESGHIIIEPELSDLGHLVHDVLATLKTKIKKKKLELVVSINEHLPLIKVDAKLIREVYSNLLSNAVKYTPDGGKITVTISLKDDEVISQIADTGYGIPTSEQPKLFEKFFRASNVINVETDGNGLGMYLVKAIIESSGGKIWFKSAEGAGTTFWFSLPKKGSKPKKGQVRLMLDL